MATAVLFSDVYAPQLAPLGYVPADTLDRTGSLLPEGGVSRTSLFNDVYTPKLAPLGLVTGATVDPTGTTLPAGGVSRTSLFNDVYAPKLGSMSRLSAFGLTSDETIVLGTGTGTAAAVTTQSWYIG